MDQIVGGVLLAIAVLGVSAAVTLTVSAFNCYTDHKDNE